MDLKAQISLPSSSFSSLPSQPTAANVGFLVSLAITPVDKRSHKKWQTSSTSLLTRSDFRPYLASVSDHYNRFEDIINHVKKEISLRSNSFFEAQGQLEDLNVKIVEECGRIQELKEAILLLDVDLVELCWSRARHLATTCRS